MVACKDINPGILATIGSSDKSVVRMFWEITKNNKEIFDVISKEYCVTFQIQPFIVLLSTYLQSKRNVNADATPRKLSLF